MKSRLEMILDPETMSPLIKVDIRKSEDMRDVIFNKFAESFGFQSNWCYVKFIEGSHHEGPFPMIDKSLLISPLGGKNELIKMRDELNERIDQMK